jgi:hypothetical protein
VAVAAAGAGEAGAEVETGSGAERAAAGVLAAPFMAAASWSLLALPIPLPWLPLVLPGPFWLPFVCAASRRRLRGASSWQSEQTTDRVSSTRSFIHVCEHARASSHAHYKGRILAECDCRTRMGASSAKYSGSVSGKSPSVWRRAQRDGIGLVCTHKVHSPLTENERREDEIKRVSLKGGWGGSQASGGVLYIHTHTWPSLKCGGPISVTRLRRTLRSSPSGNPAREKCAHAGDHTITCTWDVVDSNTHAFKTTYGLCTGLRR